MTAINARAHRLGISGVDFAMRLGAPLEGRMYVMFDSAVSLAVVTEDGLAKDVRFALSNVRPADIDRQATLAAFVAARLSGRDEGDIRAAILAETPGLPVGSNRLDRYDRGTAIALFRADPISTVITIGELDCD